MVINHMSDQHPIFQEALNDPDSPYRGWFRFSPTPGPDNEWGDNNWRKSPVRDEYYYGFFSHRMPDLNWEAEPVREEMKKIASYWLGDMGADGLRLDAVWHLMEGSDGQAGHVPRTHEMLREYGDYVRSTHPGSYTLGEVFDGSDAIFAYYPDQLDAFFAFGVSGGILDAVQTGNGTAMLDAVIRMQSQVPNERWAPFLKNHDQTRTLTVLGGDIEGARLAATFLLTLPGLPFVYYGEELGMTGDKPDPRLRTPMHWNLGPCGRFHHGHALGTAAGGLADGQRRGARWRARTRSSTSTGELIRLRRGEPGPGGERRARTAPVQRARRRGLPAARRGRCSPRGGEPGH